MIDQGDVHTEDEIMSGDYGNDFITIKDDDGEEYELEHLDTVEIGGEFYLAFLPTDIDEDDEDYGLVILKSVTEGEEEFLVSIDDDKELDAAYDVFMERFSEEEEEV